MLYQIYETQRSLMEPFADFAQAASKVHSNSLSPMGKNPFAQRVAAGYDLIYRLGKDYVKPEFGLRTVDVEGVTVAIHERIELDKPFCELRRFKRFSDDTKTLNTLKGQPAVLIVALDVDIGRPGQLGALAQHIVAGPRFEPDVENIGLFGEFFSAALFTFHARRQQIALFFREPDISPLFLD